MLTSVHISSASPPVEAAHAATPGRTNLRVGGLDIFMDDDTAKSLALAIFALHGTVSDLKPEGSTVADELNLNPAGEDA